MASSDLILFMSECHAHGRSLTMASVHMYYIRDYRIK